MPGAADGRGSGDRPGCGAHDGAREAPRRVGIHVTGIVQGVGMRPFVYREAVAHGLAGWVLNAADGVHIGQEDIPLPDVRALVGSKMCIGLSTHCPEQAKEAVRLGADYLGVGPIFATQTKEDVTAPVGYAYLDWVAANISTPFVAIGGIKEHNIAEVAAHGARCCALVSELVGAEDIAGKVAAVRRAMHQAN